MKEDEIVRDCDRHRNETGTHEKHVTKYKDVRKWMVEFLSKSESRGINMLKFREFAAQNHKFYFISYVLFLSVTSPRGLVF